MIKQIFVGLVTEGSTDERFLESIVKKTFEDVAFECEGEIEVELNIIKIRKTKFASDVLLAAKVGVENYGIMVLCVHADSDDRLDASAFQERINPAIRLVLDSSDESICKLLVAIVPIYMTEAWMLADIELLKNEIGTNLEDVILGFHRNPENIADPKYVISEAIRIARSSLTRRRRSDLSIADLYLPIGQKLSLAKLESFQSYMKFKMSVRDAFRQLKYLH